MIKYNKIQIEGDKLLLDFEIENKPYYSGILLVGVNIHTPLTYEDPKHPYHYYSGDGSTRFNIGIPISGAKNDLLIIQPLISGKETIPADSPCGADVVNEAAVYDKNVLLNKGMMYLKELGDTCEISRGFIDFILKNKALDMAIDTCNYNTAIKYWKMFTMSGSTTIKGCGCYGKTV